MNQKDTYFCLACFSHLSNLSYLGAGENNLTSIPEEIGRSMNNLPFYNKGFSI